MQEEKLYLGRLPDPLPQLFDREQQRRVGGEATVRFEGRTCSVPFRFAAVCVEVRGCARTVQAFAGAVTRGSKLRDRAGTIELMARPNRFGRWKGHLGREYHGPPRNPGFLALARRV